MSSVSESDNDEEIFEFIEKNKRKKYLEFKKQCFKDFTPLEVSIAKYLRLSCSSKQGVLRGHTISFFTASKLVDELMASKWGPGTDPARRKNKNCLFETRQACVNFMQYLMNKQMFGRAFKVYRKESKSSSPSSSSAKSARRTEREKALAEAVKPSESSDEDQPRLVQKHVKPKSTRRRSSKTSPDAKEAKRKRKFRLEMHMDQVFVDAREPYVWMYNPPSLKAYILGSLLIAITVMLSLFPIWPKQLREGVYFISITAASFMGATATVVLLKYVLLVLVWLLTLGSIQFLIFPNLLKEPNFFESFLPIYKITKASDTPKKASAKINTKKLD